MLIVAVLVKFFRPILGKKVFILIFAFLLGATWAWVDQIRHPHQLAKYLSLDSNEEIKITSIGMIDSRPIVDGDQLSFFFKCSQASDKEITQKVNERIWIKVLIQSKVQKVNAEMLKQGDLLQLNVKISKPNPPTNPGAFDFRHYLWQNNTTLVGKVDGLQNIKLLKTDSIFWTGIVEIRGYLEEKIEEVFSPEISGLMKGMLLGETKEVPSELETIYRNSGILHILAISGSHVMIVISGLFLLLSTLKMTRERIYQVLLIFIPIYMLITGLSPSVVRAGLMGMIYILAKLLHQEYSARKTIGIVFLIMMIFTPRQIFNVGFQLSFAVTGGLILFTKPLAERIQEWFPCISKKVSLFTSICLIAEMVSFPFITYHFHFLPLLSILINLFILPIFTVLIPWGYFSLLLTIILTPLGAFVATSLDGVMRILHQLLDWISNHSMFILSISDQPFWWWGFYIALFILIVYIPKLYFKRIQFFILLLLILLISTPIIIGKMDSSIHITFLDVGQGDSILIQGPNREAILIDGGGIGFQVEKQQWQMRRDPFEVGKDVVIPALRSLGVSHLDWVVLTHGDGDHIRGLTEVIDQIPIGSILVNGNLPNDEFEIELFQLMKKKGIPIKVAITGDWIQWGSHIQWNILSDSKSLSEKLNGNNASVVLELNAYNRKFLFTGDLEVMGETNLINRIGPHDIDVLKIGHHGSKNSTSDAFLNAITPEVAVVSVGKNNRYGHPSKEVLRRLEEHQINLYRTDHDGAITFSVNKDGNIYYKSWLKR